MYDPNRVNLTEDEHKLAKEFNEFFEAMAYGEGDKVKEGTEAIMEGIKQIPSAEDRRALLTKVLLANVSDEIQERLSASP